MTEERTNGELSADTAAAPPISPDTAAATAAAATGENPTSSWWSRGWMRTALVGFAAGVLGTVAVVVPYHYVTVQKPFGVVDINGIFNLRSLVLADKASTVKTPEARAALEAEAGNTGPKIDQALADVQKRCNCVLLVRAAVISNLPDYTDQVKHMLGLDGVDESALQAKITHNLVGKLSDMIAQPTPGAAPSGVDPKSVPAPGVK